MAQLNAVFSLAFVWSLIHRKPFPPACAFSLLFVLALAVWVGVFCLFVGGFLLHFLGVYVCDLFGVFWMFFVVVGLVGF